MKQELEQWQKDYVLKNHKDYSVYQLAVKVRAYVYAVRKFCEEKELEAKAPLKRRKTFYVFGEKFLKRKNRLEAVVVEQPQQQKKMERPPAKYDNMPSPYGIARQERIT